MQVLRLDGMHGEKFVEALQELRQESVTGLRVADLSHAQFLDETVLECAVGPLHTALGLAGVRAQNLDVQLGPRTAELRHAGASPRVRLIHAEDGVLGPHCITWTHADEVSRELPDPLIVRLVSVRNQRTSGPLRNSSSSFRTAGINAANPVA